MLKKVKIEEALGQRLFHDITGIGGHGEKGAFYKRGHLLTEEDLESLKDIGERHIYIGELADGLVHEEDAIKELLPFLTNENISSTGFSEGKTNLKAEKDGLFLVDKALLKKINSVKDYTIVTIDEKIPVSKGQNLAGARIIPLYTEEENVQEVKELLASGNLLQVLEFKPKKIGVIITGTEIYEGRIKDRFMEVLEVKLKSYPVSYIESVILPDDKDLICQAVDQYFEKDVDMIIFSGGMSVDPDDLTPDIINEKSDEIIFAGVPVQPGNMLTVGKKGKTFLIGVPGASLHSNFTSFDILYPWVFADYIFSYEDFLDLAVGGLL